MEQKVDNKKKIIKVVVWVIVIFALMATTHFLINYFDFPGFLSFLKALHGG
jgi:hypothetical protein